MATRTTTRSRPRLAVPPQHGAWAYLGLPLLIGLSLSGWTWLGVLFAVTWVLAYPASYFGARALTTRIRRGTWSRIARRERRDALPWTAAAGVGALFLVLARPWLVVVGVGLAALWAVGLRLALAGRERGFANDLLLVGQSLIALPLVWLISQPAFGLSAVAASLADIPAGIWWATVVCAVYFVGSVIHVKSLIREAADVRWRQANLAYHVLALVTAALSWWLLVPFGATLARSVWLKPGAKPGLVGAVEVVISVLMLIFVLLAVPR
jgi:hypothetical protein